MKECFNNLMNLSYLKFYYCDVESDLNVKMDK